MPTADTTVNWPRDSQKLVLYINEEGMYELLFSSQHPKSKDFRRHCCNVIFPQIRQQLTNKMKEEHQQAITDHQQQILSLNEDHQQGIEEKDAALALLNDDLQNLEYENVALQAQMNVYKDQLRTSRDIIIRLRTRYMDHGKDPGKGNIVMIIEKNTVPEEDEFYEFPTTLRRYNDGLLTQKDHGLKHNTPIIDL